MKEEKYEERLYMTCRNMLADEQVLTALFLMKETRRLLGDKVNTVSLFEAQNVFYQQCSKYNLGNPIPEFNVFREIYYMTNDIEDVDWELMLSFDRGECLHLPLSILNIMEELILPDTNSVLIGEGQRFVPFLRDLVKKYSHCHYLITTERNIDFILLKDIFEKFPQVSVELTSIYEYEFVESKFDLIFSVPTMGRRNRVGSYSRFMSRDYEMVALENLLLHLSLKGKLAIVMPAKITFAGGSIENLRNFVQDMYSLEAIFELPNGIFTGNGIKTCLLFISTGKTEEVVIRRYDFNPKNGKARKSDREMVLIDDSFVFYSELLEQGDWNIEKIFSRQDEDWQKFLERGNRIKLKEVAQVFRGKNITQKNDNGRIGVINISNIGEYTIDYDTLEHIEESERKISGYLLEENDLLITARGTATRVGIFRKQDYPCIASSNLLAIRPRQDLLDSTYLKIFFDSPLGGKILLSAQQGTVLVNLSFRDLQEIEIPFPSLQEQKELAEEYKKELKLYLSTVKVAEERWQGTLEKLHSQL